MTINKYILYDERGEISDALAARASRLIDLQGFYTDSNMADLWARQADLTDQINLVEGIKPVRGNIKNAIYDTFAGYIGPDEWERLEPLFWKNLTDPRTAAQQGADEDADDEAHTINGLRTGGFTI